MAKIRNRERKIFVWIDEVGEIHVSIAHRTKEELEDAFDMEASEQSLLELPFRLEGAEGLGGENPSNYYRAFEGLLELEGFETTLEVLMGQMVQVGVSLKGLVPVRKKVN